MQRLSVRRGRSKTNRRGSAGVRECGSWKTPAGQRSRLFYLCLSPSPALPCSRTPALHTNRRGTLLVIVLVVVVLLTLAAANYSAWMTTELEATSIAASDVQARMLADSGADYVATILATRGEIGTENYQHNPEMFLGVGVVDGDSPRARGRFTIIAPVEQDETSTRVRYGLMDESAKLNLNLLDKLALEDEESRNLLLGLPGMTEDFADAIRDWIDADDTTRENGAETEHYESQSVPYSAKNGPLETIDELLLVRDVTPELLYGEDANRNGLLDPNENDGEASPPLDNADGALQLGWVSFLTTVSREANLRADGTAKIDVNNGILSDLYDQLEEEFDEEVAKFIVAFRMGGPKDQPPSETDTDATLASSSTQGQQQKQQEQLVQGAATAAAGAMLNPGGTVTRGGMDLAAGAKYQIKSLWELIDPSTSRTDATVNGAKTELKSPWSADAGTLTELLPQIMDTLTTTSDTYLEGRININQARREVLIGLPDMTENTVSAILAAQAVDGDGQPSSDILAQQATTGWLFTQGLVDIWGMRAIDPFITARGDVFRAQILGFFEGGGPVSRQEIVVDATQVPPRIVFHRDLDDLGRGYTRTQIFPDQ